MILDIPEFIWRALIGGIGIAIVAGPLGACVVWKRMAYFGDTLAHASLLGITLSVLLSCSVTLAVLFVGLLLSALWWGLERRLRLSADTLLGILSHTTLALGLISVSLLGRLRTDLLGLLFGDVLALSWLDLKVILAGAAFILIILSAIWRDLVAVVVHAELAAVEGVQVARVQAIFVCLLAVLVAVCIKLVGVLLITALLVIPAAAARQWSRSPEQMALVASGVGIAAVVAGLWLSLEFDLPAGPSIVVIAAGLFVLSFLTKLSASRVG